MLRSWLHAGAGPLAIAALLVLGGCGSSFEVPEGDAAACEGVRCTAGTCVSNAGQPMCRCGGWEQAAGLLCEVASFDAPDDHGGSPEAATVLSASRQPAQGRISGSTRGQFDRDLFSFTTEPGHTYHFFCLPLSLLRCQPRMLDAQGREVRTFFRDNQRNSWVFKAHAAGPWYLEVSGEGTVGTYAYQLVDLGLDDHGDSPEQAGGVEPSDTSFVVTSTFLGDSDVIRFQTLAGHGYRVGCALPSRDSGLALRLLGPTGRVVESVDGLGSRVLPEVELQASVSQSWYLHVSPTFGQMPLSFRCWVKDLGEDDHGDSLLAATRVTPDVPVSVRLHSSKDADVLVFRARAGHAYAMRRQPVSLGSIPLLDATGARVGLARPDTLILEAAQEGDYYLWVTPPPGVTLEPTFELLVEDLGVDDHGNAAVTATWGALDVPVVVRPHGLHDMDVVAFDVEADGVYEATCEPSCLVRIDGPYRGLYGTRGELGTRRLDVTASGSLAFFVQPLRSLETVTLTLRRVGTDDHSDADVVGTTPVLTPPLALSGQFEAENDWEGFAVWLEAGREYQVELSPEAWVSFTAPTGESTPVWNGSYRAPVSGHYSVTLGVRAPPWTGAWNLQLHPR